MLVCQHVCHKTRITICNYDEYQNCENPETGSASMSARMSARDPNGITTGTIPEEVKKEKRKKEETYLSKPEGIGRVNGIKNSQLTEEELRDFEEWYRQYPRHEARTDAEKAWKQVVIDPLLVEKIHRGLELQLPELEQREKQYIPLPASWLRGRRWEDETKDAIAEYKRKIMEEENAAQN